MSFESAPERDPEAVEAVRDFLAMYYGSEIAQTDDRDEQLLLFHVGTHGAVVAISADFFAAFEPSEIREKLASWNVPHLSRTLERGARLLVTSDGAEEDLDASRL